MDYSGMEALEGHKKFTYDVLAASGMWPRLDAKSSKGHDVCDKVLIRNAYYARIRV